MVRHPFYFPASTVLLIVSGIMIGSPGAALRPRGAVRETVSDRRCASAGNPGRAASGPPTPTRAASRRTRPTLAHQLAEAGHDVDARVVEPPLPGRALPGRAGGARRRADVAALPAHPPGAVLGPARHLGARRAPAARRRRDHRRARHPGRRARRTWRCCAPPASGARPTVRAAHVLIAHNVLPHESHPGDRQLMQALLRRVDAVLVHSDRAGPPGRRARRRTGRGRRPAAAPARRAAAPRARRHDGPPRLLALGIVRDYKGVDLLARGPARRCPTCALTVAGELWGDSRATGSASWPPTRALARPGEVLPGYVPADRLAELLAAPRRARPDLPQATASQNALLGHAPRPAGAGHRGRHLPGSRCATGSTACSCRPGRRGRAGRRAAPAAEPRQCRPAAAEVRTPGPGRPVGPLPRRASRRWPHPAPVDVPPGRGRRPGRRGRSVRPSRRARVLAPLRRAIRRPRGPVVDPDPLRPARAGSGPPTCSPTAPTPTRRRRLARALGLPRPGEPVAAWAALGALAAIVRVRDDGRRVVGHRRRVRQPLPLVPLGARRRLRAGRARASPGGAGLGRACSTSTPAASTSSPGCTPAAATPTTSTTRSARPPGRCARAACSSLTAADRRRRPGLRRRARPTCAASSPAPTTSGFVLVGDLDGDVTDTHARRPRPRRAGPTSRVRRACG